MNKYRVLGLGNPLIDLLIKVDDESLNQLDLNKNSMNLVDEKRQNEILDFYKEKEIKKTVGGSCGNTMVMLAQLGEKAAFVGKMGNDSLGKTYQDKLLDEDVVSFSKSANGATGSTVILVSEDGSRTMNTHLGLAVEFNTSDINEEEIANAEMIYVEGYLWDTEEQKKAVELAVSLAKKNGVQVALTLSDPFCVSRHHETFSTLIKNYVDILFCNDEELSHLMNQGSRDKNIQAVKEICSHVISTDGKNGADVITPEKIVHVDSFETNVVDTTGAGDSFAAGYLFGLLNDYPTHKSATLASYCAKEIIAQMGPRYEGDFKSLVAEYL